MFLPDIQSLFKPRSIAIIGVSHDPSKVGYKILENILSGGFKGKIFLVNSKGGEVLGLPVYKSILEVGEKVDLAIIAIPAKSVFGAVEECVERKIKFLVVVASGFSEIGNKEEENRIVNLAKNGGSRILGPNVFGIYSSEVSLNATFGAKAKANPGNLAIVSQSGALGIALIGMVETEKVGLSSVVFEGNKSDLNEKDLLPYFLDDKQTKVIFIYLEGVKDGRELVPILKAVTAKKPVIILKAGLSKKGKEAVSSHTGSLAGEAKIFSSVMEQCGVIRAESLKQAMDWSKFLAGAPLPKGENTVIITNGGGMGILATDACEEGKINLFNDPEKLKKTFLSVVPDFGSLKNPVDLTGIAKVEDYQKAIEMALKNPKIHSIICLGCETAVLDNQKLAGLFEDICKKATKPIVFAFVGGEEVAEKLLSLKTKGVPIFSEVRDAVGCLSSLCKHFRNLQKKPLGISHSELAVSTAAGVGKIVNSAVKEKRKILSPEEIKKMMALLEIPLPKSFVVRSARQASEAAAKIGFPVVLKVVSREVLHKTETGGVILNIEDEKQLSCAYKQLLKNNSSHKIEGVEVAEMVKGGVEMIVGAKRDKDFGTVVMIGLGGIYTEVLKDISFRSFPVGLPEAGWMIEELKSYPLLAGVRGGKEKDILKLAEIILKLGQIIESCPSVAEIEINPVSVFEKGVKALDVKITAET